MNYTGFLGVSVCFCSLPVERVDQAGVICKQEGIFRVNCMDCLDRTNVVQAAIARVVMEQQARISEGLGQVLSALHLSCCSQRNLCV